VPIYMKFGKIKGDVTAKGHEGWIELTSAQLGVNRQITSPTGRGANREASAPSMSEIVVTKFVDQASTDLFRASMWGEGVDVEIHFVKSDDSPANDPINPYMTLKLKNTLISNYSVSGHGGDSHSKPMESLTLNFTGIEYALGGPKNTKNQAPPPQTLKWDLSSAKGS